MEEARVRRMSKGRVTEVALGMSYAESAKKIYELGKKEGWSQKKIAEYL